MIEATLALFEAIVAKESIFDINAPSAYDLFTASVETVGVAKLVIFCEFNDTLPVGTEMLCKGVVFA